MFKPKTTISAVSASPKGNIERDGRLENSSGAWIRYHPSMGSKDLIKEIRPFGRIFQVAGLGFEPRTSGL